MRKARDRRYASASSSFTVYCPGFHRVAMSTTKPLDVVILQRFQNGDEVHWERYEERGEKMKQATSNWSCYILATEDEVGVICVLAAALPLCGSKTSCLRSGARIPQRNLSLFRYPSIPAAFSSISFVRRARREIRRYVTGRSRIPWRLAWFRVRPVEFTDLGVSDG